HSSRILLTGSPMREVLEENAAQIDASDAVQKQGLTPQGYFLVSLHREENVDNPDRLQMAVSTLEALYSKYNIPILVSTHPRTRKRLEALGVQQKEGFIFHPPFGFHDYIKLQKEAKLVLSDSGTISEESSILDFPAVTMRDFIERPESQDTGAIVAAGLQSSDVLDAVEIALELFTARKQSTIPNDYAILDTSFRVLTFIRSAAHSHFQRTGIRK